MEQTIKVADKRTVDAMQREITQMQSLLGTLGEGIAEVASAIAAVKADVANVKSAVGTVNNTVNTVNTNTSNIKSVVDALKAEGSSAVKSVQRGVAKFAVPSDNYGQPRTLDINIAKVNTSKSFVILNNYSISDNQFPYIVSLSETKLTVKTRNVSSSTLSASINEFSWQVVELN